MNNNISIIENKCCGCESCYCACTEKAITMQENEEGFFFPTIIEEKCINCGKCLRVCPIQNVYYFEEEQKCFAAYSNNKRTIRTSTSGGIFYEVAKAIIDKNGVVFGCCGDKTDTYHTIISTTEDLYKLQGSKYVQSNLNDVFPLVKERLEKKQNVLFSGTPCQVAGLKLYLGKEYSELYTVDIICHGVPSSRLFKKYVEWLENKYCGEIVKYDFRNKDRNDWSLTYKAIIKNKNKEKSIGAIASIDPYYYAFLEGKTYRESCYSCPYSCKKRTGDITLGDFWGIEDVDREMDNVDGVSAVIINSQKGKKLLELIKNNLTIKEVDISQVSQKNGNLISPTKRPSERDVIYKALNERGFEYTRKKYMIHKKIYIERVRNMFPNSFRKRIKRIITRR